MKIAVVFILFFLFSYSIKAQQSSIQGTVSIHNSETETGKRVYINNAQVEDYFGRAQPAVTDIEGWFKLIFVKTPENTSVTFAVRKPGFVVVNISSLTAITGQKETIKISMATEEKIAEYRKQIYLVGKTAAEKRIEKLLYKKINEIKNLKKAAFHDEQKIEELSLELNNLEEQKLKIESIAENLARTYSAINLDDASKDLKKAFKLFQEGNLDASFGVISTMNLARQLNQILEERKKINSIRRELDERDSVLQARSDDIVTALKFKANLHEIRYEFDSARVSYKMLLNLDSLNIEFLYHYANFLSLVNEKDSAIAYYQKVLKSKKEIITIESDYNIKEIKVYDNFIPIISNNLGVLFFEKKNYELSEKYYLQALENNRYFRNIESSEFEFNIAVNLNNLANLYSETNQISKAKEAYEESLKIRLSLSNKDPETYKHSLGILRNNMGMHYYNRTDLDNAETEFLEAINIYVSLDSSKCKDCKTDIALTKNNLGKVYFFKDDLNNSKKYFLEALQIRQQLYNTSSIIYEFDLIETMYWLMRVFTQEKSYLEANKYCLNAIEYFKKSKYSKDINYSLKIADLYLFSAVILSQSNMDFKYVEESFLTSIKYATDYSNIDSRKSDSTLALYFEDFAFFYKKEKKYSQAINIYTKALEKYRKLSLNSIYDFRDEIDEIQNNIRAILLIMNASPDN